MEAQKINSKAPEFKSELAIEVDRVSKVFRKREQGTSFWRNEYAEVQAVKEMSFNVRRGEIFGTSLVWLKTGLDEMVN